MITNGWRFWRLGLWIYGIQLILSVIVGVQLRDVLVTALSKTAAVDQLSSEWVDYLILDLSANHGETLGNVLGIVLLLLIIYLLIQASLAAGIWSCVVGRSCRWNVFWEGVKRNVSAYLLIAVLAMLLFFAWTLLVWVPSLSRGLYFLEHWRDERWFVWLMFGLLVLWLSGIYWIWLVSNYARSHRTTQVESVWRCLRHGVITGSRRYVSWWLTLMMLTIVGLIAALLVPDLEARVVVSTMVVTLLMFMIQQVVLFCRVMVRLGLIREITSDKPHQNQQIPLTQHQEVT